jgi:serine/threonine protein kinase
LTCKAPEVIRGEGYGKAVDWWTIGCLLYEMVVGQPPYQDDNTKVLYEKILSKEIKYPRFMSTACQDLISKVWSYCTVL